MFDFVSNLALGFHVAAQPQNLAFCLLGALVGTLVGVLAGLYPAIRAAKVEPVEALRR